jgi:hypothetical protein
MCHKGLEGNYVGCLEWESDFGKPDFVFFCPFCSKKGKSKFKVGA